MGKMYHWQPDMIRFMRQSETRTGASRALAARLLAHLPQDGHICDAGCGLGYLSLALAPHVRRVTAADISSAALEGLGEAAPGNVTVFCGDLFAQPAEKPYDAMIFNLFGSAEEIRALSKNLCRGPALVVRRNRRRARFSVGEHDAGCFTFDRLCADLERMGVPYHEEVFELEMGQPFRSEADAVTFFQLYSRDPAPQRIGWADIRDRLVPDPAGEYAWYLPVRNSMGLVVFDAAKLP